MSNKRKEVKQSLITGAEARWSNLTNTKIKLLVNLEEYSLLTNLPLDQIQWLWGATLHLQINSQKEEAHKEEMMRKKW